MAAPELDRAPLHLGVSGPLAWVLVVVPGSALTRLQACRCSVMSSSQRPRPSLLTEVKHVNIHFDPTLDVYLECLLLLSLEPGVIYLASCIKDICSNGLVAGPDTTACLQCCSGQTARTLSRRPLHARAVTCLPSPGSWQLFLLASWCAACPRTG